MLGKSISSSSAILMALAVCAAGLIAFMQFNVQDKIALEQRKVEESPLRAIVPRSKYNNQMLDDTLPVSDHELLGLTQPEQIYIARQDGEAVAVILPVMANDSYSGEPIKMQVGIFKDGSIAGVRVLTHTETPGLGDKIDANKSDWLLSFKEKSLVNPPSEQWAVKKDSGVFDQFTGATITPRAVVKGVYQALQYFKKNKTVLLAPKGQAEQAIALQAALQARESATD